MSRADTTKPGEPSGESIVALGIATDHAASAEAQPRRKVRWSTQRKLLAVVSIIGGLGLWQLVAVFDLVDPLFFPEFTVVIERLWELLSSGELNDDMWATMSTFVLGLALSVVLGALIGIALAASRWVDAVLWPWAMALNSVPRIAFIPLLILILGLGSNTRVAVVVLTAVFPVIVNVTAGLRNVDQDLLEMGRSFDKTSLESFWSISLPSSVPFLLAGFRIAVAQGLIGVVVAEFFVSNVGLGFTLFQASSLFDVPTVYAMMILLGAAGVVLSEGAKWLESRFESWRTS